MSPGQSPARGRRPDRTLRRPSAPRTPSPAAPAPTPGAEEVGVIAVPAIGEAKRFRARVRIDTPKEWDDYQHGGILHYVIRQLVATSDRGA